MKTYKWNVYYNGSFFSHTGREHAGSEINVGKKFEWGGKVWYIPAVYSCASGLVVDYCLEVEPEEMSEYIEKWNLLEDEYGNNLTSWQREQAENENPLHIDFSSSAIINGKATCAKRSHYVCRISVLPETVTVKADSKRIIDRYGLDASKCYGFYRVCYPWTTARKPKIKSLELCIEARASSFTAKFFDMPDEGESVTLIHPLTGKEYTITAEKIIKSSFEKNHFTDDMYDFPENYIQMFYTVEPQSGSEKLVIRDSFQSDSPIQKSGASAIAIIGGADGPTAVFFGGHQNDEKMRVACSALHFSSDYNVKWQAIFNEKMLEDITVKIISSAHDRIK